MIDNGVLNIVASVCPSLSYVIYFILEFSRYANQLVLNGGFHGAV